MGEDNFPGFLDPDHLRQISERFPELAGALPDIPGAATFVRDMEAAKAKAEVAFRQCEAAEKWGDTRTDQEDIEVLVDLAGRFGTFYRWRPAACAYVWEMVSTYLRSPIADCKPETFEDLAHVVLDVYSERVYEEKLKPYEKDEWITYERSKAEFQEYVRWQLDPLVQAECLDRWQERIAPGKTNFDDRDKLRPKTDYVPREPVRRTQLPQSLREPREFNRKWLDDVHRWLRDELQKIVGPEENESALVGKALRRDAERVGSNAPAGEATKPHVNHREAPAGSTPKPRSASTNATSSSDFRERSTGSMDRVSMTDPIWDVSGTNNGPISIKRLSGEVDVIDPSIEDEPDDADLKPEEELRINEATIGGRSELRTEIEAAFSGADWPPAHAIIQAFRRHAVMVFDVNAAAYRGTITKQGRDAKVALHAMSRNLLVGLFGREWENSPGERVVRIRWEDGADGWKGQEIAVLAGNDPDPTCLYHQLVGDAIKHRYRFHAPIPPHVPGEPPGLGVSNLEWWQYIGLKERHNLAMVIQPYLEDRIANWQIVYSTPLPKVDVSPVPQDATTRSDAARTQSELAAKRRGVVMPILKQKRWSRGKLVTESGVGKNSVYEYLDGKRNPGYDNRKAMAEALGLAVDALPE